MGGYRAFLAEDSNNYQYELTYYHNPNRWRNNIINTENPIRNVDNWSDEIKYCIASALNFNKLQKYTSNVHQIQETAQNSLTSQAI